MWRFELAAVRGWAAAMVVVLLTTCVVPFVTADTLPALGATGELTVSGISAGGYAAVQFHVSFSSQVKGAGILAAGPFWCAQDNVDIALGPCMKYPSLISVSELIGIATSTALTGTIDSLDQLHESRVWLLSGTVDSVVNPGVVFDLQKFYEAFIPRENIQTVYNLSAEHSFVTGNYGNPCNYLGDPYINNCGFDSAGALLQWLYGPLNAPVPANNDSLVRFSQHDYMPVWTDASGLADIGYAYIPNTCRAQRGCRVHVALHGCLQYSDLIGEVFVRHAGYNEWAEANGIVVLYPQAHPTPLNPKGCFDWWGYTGPDYACKLGMQNAAIKLMVDKLQKE